MQKTIIMIGLVLGFLIFSGCSNPSGTGTDEQESEKKEFSENYGDGKVSRKYTRVGDKIEGLMTEYYPDGALKSEILFENGEQTGVTKIYYPDGSLKEVQHYLQGKKHGGDTIFYPGGTPQFTTEFNEGQRNGYLRKWSEDGKINYEAKYWKDTLIEVNGEIIRK